jgi:hypothetical protein
MRTSKKASVMLAGSFEGGRETDPFSRLGGRWQTGRQVGCDRRRQEDDRRARGRHAFRTSIGSKADWKVAADRRCWRQEAMQLCSR